MTVSKLEKISLTGLVVLVFSLIMAIRFGWVENLLQKAVTPTLESTADLGPKNGIETILKNFAART